MSKNLFETATRKKIRFESERGFISLEQLWDVPLRSRDRFNLNEVAKTANEKVKVNSEESFVSTAKASPALNLAKVALDCIKHVIATKLGEEEKAATRAANKVERDKLVEVLADKQDDKLKGKSEAAIKKRIAELDAA